MKITLVTIGMALLTIGFNVNAAPGQGGISGTVAVVVDKNVSSAIAIGKSNAYSGGTATTDTAVAVSVGSGGSISMLATGGIYVKDIGTNNLTDLGLAQANSMGNAAKIELDGDANTIIGTVGTPP